MNASPLVLPAVPAAFRELRPSLLTLIKTVQFSGNPHNTFECSLKHLKDFLDVCDTTTSDAVTLEFIRMKAFKFTLAGAAADWFNRLPAASITSWEQLSDAFTDKFFPAHMTKEGRRRIYEFAQGEREPLDMAWERYKSLIHACPTHNLPLYQLISIFFDAMNDFSRQRVNAYSNNKFVTMEPKDAWEQLDEITTFDAQYTSRAGERGDRAERKRGLYEVPKEIDREVRAQYQQDEANKNKRLIQALKACQICHNQGHSAPECTNSRQGKAPMNHEEEEVNYFNQGYQNQGYQQPNQPRYRPPGYQERAAPRVTTNDDLRDLIVTLSKNQETFAQHTRTQFKGVRAHLDDLETWKKDINSQVANLAESIPRQQGKLPGRSEENPKNHQIAAMTLYYEGEKVVEEAEEKKEERAAENTSPVRDSSSTGRDDSDTGAGGR